MASHPLFFQRIVELTPNYPLADWPAYLKQAVLTAIEAAWSMALVASSTFNDENDATFALRTGLLKVRAERAVPLFSDSFAPPTREACEPTYDGRTPDKRPDLQFRRLDAMDDNDGWYVECKIVDAKHYPSQYVKKGIQRFIAGEYAWAMPSTLMLAYAADGKTIHGNLAPKLVQLLGHPAPTPLPSGLSSSYDAAATRHQRPFPYLGTGGNPGDIEIIHVWLRGGTFV